VGRLLRPLLRTDTARLVLVDRVPLTAETPAEDIRRSELTGPTEITTLIGGADGIVHLAGVPDEAPLSELLEGNVIGTHHVLEAARRAGVMRVVLASSSRLTGFYPLSQQVSPEMPPRPDGLYGVSKVAVEALGRLYADKFGLEVVCLRLGSFEPEPTQPRQLATWLSPRDCAGFVRAALTAPLTGFSAVYAISNNTRRFWNLDDTLGYRPVDDAETYADQIPGADEFFDTAGPQGGAYATPEFTLRHIEG
jgi:uronate dehydrogenase